MQRANRSRTIRLGDTEVLRIGLGTNRLTKSADHIEFIRAAVAAGVRVIDTAYSYAGGDSEETIGAALSPLPEGCIVATKGGYAPGRGRPEELRAQIDTSLQRLRLERIPL